MRWTINGSLDVAPAAERLEEFPPEVSQALAALGTETSIGCCRIDPDLADTEAFCRHYSVPLEASANCVIVAGKRGGETSYAACLALATTRVNVNNVVRKRMEVRKASFAPMETAVALTGMEYGGITPFGLPVDWPVLIDVAVASRPELVVGGGKRGMKLLVPGSVLAELPGAEVVDDLAS